ncbi:hypothetical protein E4R24_21240 [Escherichia coli]|uniref:hypothetical protein n=1 Tax=Escherichia coli TaxID=562 RepID=UPI00110EEBD6|nr:hypothetical protein [Escherichia coli]TMW16521.1 hypothetical protein E4R24_21240 [Escherichia coli]
MSHDFSIERKKDKKVAFFFGYANAVFYKNFHCENFNNGCSGSNEGKTISKLLAEKALKKIIESDEIKSYPDPNRINGIKNFYNDVVLRSNDTDTFFIHFS